jgi:hypothetical protein
VAEDVLHTKHIDERGPAVGHWRRDWGFTLVRVTTALIFGTAS